MNKYLDDLQKLADAATPGPWDASHKDTNHFEVTTRHGYADPYWIAQCETQHDTDFIAASRDAVPKLIQALRVAMESLEFISTRHSSNYVPERMSLSAKKARDALGKDEEK